MLLLNLLLFLVFGYALIKSSEWTVSLATKLAKFFRIREFVVAFVLLAVSTSLPELFVAITSSFNKTPDLILGTVIGSNIVNITLVVGAAVLVTKGLKLGSRSEKKDGVAMLFIAALPIIFLFDGTISRLEGIILLSVFAFYIYHIFKQRKVSPKPKESAKETPLEDVEEYAISFSHAVKHILLVAVSFVFLFISANYVVKYSVALAADLHLPTFFIGLFVVALGTSLPELALSIQAARKGKAEMIIGTNVGSVIANSTLVLGTGAVLAPLVASTSGILFSGFFMLLVLALFVGMMKGKAKISVPKGVFLLLLYLLFIFFEFFIKKII